MTYPASAETFEELVRVARRVIDRQTGYGRGSLIEDAIILARWVLAEDERRGIAGIIAVVESNRK